MPDSSGLYERVTVGEYLDFFASAHGIHGEDRVRSVKRVLELTEIGPLRAVHVTTLSKGQKQRVLLARTLLHDPEVLVLDEPASDLDPRARIELRALLGVLGRSGKTVLLSSHILTELAELCDAIGVLEGGRIVVSGPIEEVRGRSARATPARDGPRPRRRGDRVAPGLLEGSIRRGPRRRIARGPAALEVTHEGDDWAIAELVCALAKAQIPLGAVEPERTDLERIFMDVTQAAGDGSPGATGSH